MSYRDSPTDLTGGAVSIGDAFDQMSYVGAHAGVSATLGVFRRQALEPLVLIDVTYSQLSKSSDIDGVSSKGNFDFAHAGIAGGARWWLSPSFNLNTHVQMATAIKNTMKTVKTNSKDKSSLGELSYSISNHKKTQLGLGFQWRAFSSPFAVGLVARLGSGCFDCESSSTAKLPRVYLTRSAMLTLAWQPGAETDERFEPEYKPDPVAPPTAPPRHPSQGGTKNQNRLNLKPITPPKKTKPRVKADDFKN